MTYGYIPLNNNIASTASLDDCVQECYREGFKCQGFTYQRSNPTCSLIRQFFTDAHPGGPGMIAQGTVYVKDAFENFHQGGECNIKGTFHQLVSAMMFCDKGWVYYEETKSCYLPIYTTEWNKYSFDEAIAGCRQHNSTVASVHSDEENSFIKKEIFHSTDMYWLGGKQDTAESEWYWQDNSTFDYTNWIPGEPNNLNPPFPMCLFPYYSPGWYDNTCTGDGYQPCSFICKKNASPVPLNKFESIERAQGHAETTVHPKGRFSGRMDSGGDL
ncbi:unnamed protein product [Anisakis simplex]|uniref:C-type lectin domain-containing protein n=1 Tax=Anisakis simplex TaxID=6269 RepID=A0A0M3J2X5_ANISI|nr:unnamed protein product [Anisakis simplex]